MNHVETRIVERTTLADDWGVLTKYRLAQKRRDGTWEERSREAYDRGHGAVALLYDPKADTVLLTRQFRLPVFLDGFDAGALVEAPAGLLDGAAPAARMAEELKEETGYAARNLTQVWDLFMSPGSVTERLVFFIAEYDRSRPVGAGGGNRSEGEDITVLHIPLAEALQMCRDGRLRDAKTILLLQRLALDRRPDLP